MFCTSTRPRYQVSVYRTIGPLVLSMKPSKGGGEESNAVISCPSSKVIYI